MNEEYSQYRHLKKHHASSRDKLFEELSGARAKARITDSTIEFKVIYETNNTCNVVIETLDGAYMLAKYHLHQFLV